MTKAEFERRVRELLEQARHNPPPPRRRLKVKVIRVRPHPRRVWVRLGK